MERPATPEPAHRRVDFRSRKVLVVDDDDDIRATLAEVLRDEGYEVEEAADGLEALAAINNARPALILLDLMMPRMTGQDVLRELLKSPAAVPVVVITAAPHATALGGLPVLVKPLNLDDLLTAARTYVS